MRAQVDYVINGGLHGILAFGSNGEFYQIEEEEMERGFKIMVDQAAGRVPVYFGIGAINTKKCVRLAKMAVANGAAGISILQPMFLKPNLMNCSCILKRSQRQFRKHRFCCIITLEELVIP